MRYALFCFLITLSAPAWAADAAAVWLFNTSREEVLISKNPNLKRPMASITKIMTAMVALDHDRDLDRRVRLDPRVGTRLPVTDYSRRDLLAAMLVRSDNAAAETLASDYPGGRRAFLDAMNSRAHKLRMINTKFADPSGLSRQNISTVSDVHLMIVASLKYDVIRQASVKKQVLLESHYNSRVRTIELANTNQPLLFEFDNIVVSKTGFTRPAGWCVAMAVENGPDVYIIVVLGSATPTARADLVKRILYNHLQDPEIHEIWDWRL